MRRFGFTPSSQTLVGIYTSDRDFNSRVGDFLDGFQRLPADDQFDPELDFNGDGSVDFGDFLIFASHYGESR